MNLSAAITLSSDTRTTSGILLLTLVAVEFGGLFVLRLVRGRQPATPFQRSFARAGHAHAGVLVTLALVGQILADAAALDGTGWRRSCSRPASSSPQPEEEQSRTA
jgi:hypothetical protein